MLYFKHLIHNLLLKCLISFKYFVLAGERLLKYYTLPNLRVQKIENTKECINYMAERGINVTGIRPEGKLNYFSYVV